MHISFLNQSHSVKIPKTYTDIKRQSELIGFNMLSDLETGVLLRTLAASKPGGRFLELGSGLGLSTSWILDGMSDLSTLLSIDNDQKLIDYAEQFLGFDTRLTLECVDGEQFIKKQIPASVDFIFADAWPGKYSLLDETIALLKPGGMYLIDDMLPQDNWPQGHERNAQGLIAQLMARQDIQLSIMNYSTGLVLCTKL